MAARRSSTWLGILCAAELACATDAGVREFPDRPVAWQEHDAEDVPHPPQQSDLDVLDWALLLRDDVRGEIDRILALQGKRPAVDVNADDEVPCSTWFCPRNHLNPMPPAAVAAGPAGTAPRMPLRIVRGKNRGATPGFQTVDADGRRYLLKLDPPGRLGMATAAEAVCARLFHAAGYNVSSSFVLDLEHDDITVDADATFKLYGVEARPLTMDMVRSQLSSAAHTPDGRLRAVAVSWLDGKVLGPFDMFGRRSDDPNDRIPHEARRSLRASWMMVAWLAVFDASAINTLDAYIEEGGRHFVRHYLIDFGAGLGSASIHGKGPHQGGQHRVEIGRTLASALSFGLYRRNYQSDRDPWLRYEAMHPELGWFPAEGFDAESFRTNRKVPAHQRMTERDAYWGAKVVTSFSEAQLAAVAATGKFEVAETSYLARALAVRRDVIGRRYLTRVSAVEAPEVRGSGPGARVCFDDLSVARGYAAHPRLRYAVHITDERHRSLGEATVRAQGRHTCVPVGEIARGYRVVAIRTESEADGVWTEAKPTRVHTRDGRVVGLDRDD